MAKAIKSKRSRRKRLRRADFAGDGGPYSEVIVKISIRILDEEISRSRLAVNVYPDPALEGIARESLKALEHESFGYNEHGVFGACLSENLNGWEDMEKGSPRIDENYADLSRREDAKRMNAYIEQSVNWALALHKAGIQEVKRNEGEDSPKKPGGFVMEP